MIAYVWPEPRASAAGLRSWNLIHTFLKANWELTYASASSNHAARLEVEAAGIPTVSIQANDARFDEFLKRIQPDFVIFDRFVIEEQFGWRVEEHCPNSVRIIDSQDLHFLRRAREQAVQAGLKLADIQSCQIELETETTLREIASILRSDCTLILSDFEMNLLITRFNVSPALLFLSRFHYSDSPHRADASCDGLTPSFQDRTHFAMIGNFRHAPNSDGILWFHRKIWPLIRKKDPQAQVHIYGAYPPKSMMELTDPSSGFYVKGPARDQFEVLKHYRVNLAPLRFGAGIKGKITDGWWAGTPVIATPIGAEGMAENLPWGGDIASDPEDFAQRAQVLYQDENLWKEAQTRGFELLRSLYSQVNNSDLLIQHFVQLRTSLQANRKKNFMGSVLRFHLHRSTKYFSKWIEAKNSKTPLQ